MIHLRRTLNKEFHSQEHRKLIFEHYTIRHTNRIEEKSRNENTFEEVRNFHETLGGTSDFD